MIRETVLCKARSMPRQILLDVCVPNPAHPACKQCDSPNIDLLKPEDQTRLRSQDGSDGGDEGLFDEADDIEADDDGDVGFDECDDD